MKGGLHADREVPRLIVLAGGVIAAGPPAAAPTTFTMSSWVSPQHHVTILLQTWASEAEKATNGRVKFQMLPKHPSAPPGTFDAAGRVSSTPYVTASYSRRGTS